MEGRKNWSGTAVAGLNSSAMRTVRGAISFNSSTHLPPCSGVSAVKPVMEDRHVGGLGALENLTGVDPDLTIHVHTIGVVAHQPAGFDSFARGIGRGNPIGRRERRKLDPPAREERIASDVHRVDAIVHESGEGRLDLTTGAGVEDLNLQSDCTGGIRYVS